MCIKKKTTARDKSYVLIGDSIHILSRFKGLQRRSDKKLPSFLTEALELTEFYANSYIDFYVRDLELFLKIEKSSEYTEIEKSSLNDYLNRKTFDTVSKLLYVSQLDVLERGVFILAQLLGDIYSYGKADKWAETYKTLDANYRKMATNLLKKSKVGFPDTVGVSKKKLKKMKLNFPATEQILKKHLGTYVSDHKNLSLTSEEVYDDYRMLSDSIHTGLTASMAVEHSSNYRAIAGVTVRTRMIIEILNTYYFNKFLDEEVQSWLKEFLTIKDDFLAEWKVLIERI